jgi:hypothetical protein
MFNTETSDIPEESPALALLDTTDLKQQEVYNQLVESFNIDSLRADLFLWVVYDNIPFAKVESKHFKKLFGRLHPFVDKSVIPTARTLS